jgi:hypothetical protein
MAVAPAAETHQADPMLAGDVLAHLDMQLDSARRLLAIVLEQGAAIRQRDIQNVVRMAGALQVEMHRRESLEAQRMYLLQRAGSRLAIGPGDVSLSLLEGLMDDESAEMARLRSAELRGMLAEIQREHHTNRALMQQELAFLDHLLRLAGGTGGYDADGDVQAANRRGGSVTRRPMFEMEA